MTIAAGCVAQVEHGRGRSIDRSQRGEGAEAIGRQPVAPGTIILSQGAAIR